MKTSALFQNTIFSFFLKRASTVKYCAFFAAYVLCSIGTWGADYTWAGEGTDLNWTNVYNWDGSSYPGTDDTAIFKGDEEVKVVLDADIEISKLQTGTDGSNTVTIDTNGHTLTASSFYLEEAEADGNNNTNTVITGSGSVETKTFDFPNKYTHNVTIGSGTTLKISETLYGNAVNSGTLTFKGSGTLYLPASGANVDYGESKIDYDISSGLKILPKGEPTYYTVTATGLDDFPNDITITITRKTINKNGLQTVNYPYTFTTTNKGGGTFSFNGHNGDSDGSLSIAASTLTEDITLSYSGTLDTDDGFTLTIKTPDNSMELAVISYYKDTPRWTGAASSDWNTTDNWDGITDISDITSTSEITINSGVLNYPEISSDVSLKSLTITSNAKVTMKTGGTLTVDKLICTGNSNFTATGGTVVFGNSETDVKFSADYPDNSSFYNVEIAAGKNFTSSNSMTVTGNFTSNGNTKLSSGTLTVSGTTTVSSGAEMNVNAANFSGTVTNDGEISGSSGEITFSGTTDNSGTITASYGAVTFGGSLTNDGTITGGSGAVTFGETTNSGEITCSTTSTIFNGAVTVSAGGTITGTTGTAEFKSTVTNNGTITGGSRAVTFGGTVTNNGEISGTTGILTFSNDVTNDGTITAGNSGNNTAAVTFSQKYAGTGGTLVGSDTDSTYIDFYGDTEFGTVTVNKSSLRFRGSTAQTFKPNGQSVNAVIFANTGGTTGTTLNGSLTADGLITVSGILSCDSSSSITANAGLTIENTGTLSVNDTSDNPAKLTFPNANTALTNSGTLNAGNSEITLSNGTEWNNGGTFNCGTGTVIVSGSATISGNNTFYNFKCTTPGATVTFEAGKTQTISGDFTITGNTYNKILLTSDNTWTIDVSPAKTKVKNATIKNSKSLQVLAGLTDTDVDYTTWTDNGGNINWFSASYIWKGSENTDWGTAKNWTDTNGNEVAVAPQKNNNEVDITIGKVDEPAKNTLEVNSDLSLKSITVNSGSTIDLASYSVETKDTDIGFTNNGTVRLEGTQNITGTMINGSGSTVEYYGTTGTSLPWDGDSSSTGKNYENIAFTTGASASDIEDTVTVSGTTTIDTGSADVKLSSADNIFSGEITIKSGGAVSIRAITAADTEEVKIAAGAKCNSLEINGNTALYGNVTTTGAQAYNGNVTLYANSSLVANSGGTAQTVTLGKDLNSQIKTNGTAQTLSVGTESVSSNCTVNGTFNAQLASFTVYGETTVSANGTVTATMQSYTGAVTVSAGGTIKGSTGTAEFKSTVTNNGTITGSSGAVTFGGNVTNDGEISGSSGTITFSGTTDNSGIITASDGAVTFGETTNSGGITCSTTTTVFNGAVTVSAGGTITGTEGTAEFKSTVTNSGTIIGSSGAVTFGGNVTNDGEISGSSGEITFSGTYGSSTATEATPAILKASSDKTYFSSDADFSYTTFTANGGMVLFNSATGQTLTTNEQTFNNVTLPDTGTTSLLTVNGTLNINGALTTGANRTLDMQTNNSALNVVGITDNSGEIKLGSQPAQFTGTVTNSGKITASDGAVTFGETTNSGGITCSTTTTVFNGAVTVSAGGTITGTEGAVTFGGNVTNDGEINGSSGIITFSGTYGSSTATEATPAILKASSGYTYFSSDADFSYTTFTANNGIVLFSSTATTGQKLTLPNNTVSFNEITIQTSAGGFTAERTESGNLSANKLTLASTNAGAVFNVPVTAETIENSGGSFNITFNSATTVTNSVTFGTTGMLTLGNDTTDTLTFAGGITHTQGNTTLCGKIITDSAPVALSNNTNIKTLTLTGDSAVQTTGADGTGSGAAITLGSVSGMGKALTLTGRTGNITVYGAVGAESAKLGNITIASAEDVKFESTINCAQLTQTAGSGTSVFRDAVTASGAISLTGNIFTFDKNITTQSSLLAEGTTITFSGAVQANQDITVTGNSDTAKITFGSTATAANGKLSASAETLIFENKVSAGETITLSATGTITLKDDITSNGSQTYNGQVSIESSPVTLSALNTENGSIQFNGTVNSAGSIQDGTLILIAGKDVSQTSSAVISIPNLILKITGVTILNSAKNYIDTLAAETDGEISIKNARTLKVGSITYGTTTIQGINSQENVHIELTGTSGTLMLSSPITAAGNISQTGADAVYVNAAIESTGGEITFENPVETQETGVITAQDAITFKSSCTSRAEIKSTSGDITFEGTSDISADVTASNGNITFTGALTLSDDAIITGGENNTVYFKNTADSKSAENPHKIEIIDANAEFDDGIGCTAPVSTVYIQKSAVIKESIKSTGNQTYAGAVTLGNEDGITFESTGGAITFKSTLDSDSPETRRDVSFAAPSEDAGVSNIIFKDAAGKSVPLGNITLSGMAEFQSDFEQGESDGFVINGGTVLVGGNGFICGTMSVSDGASFIQTGSNKNNEIEKEQSVKSIENNGTVIWDKNSDGGTLTINGDITGENASKTEFNKKTVYFYTTRSLSGIFYDLTIPLGTTAINEDGICVLHNFIIDGTYTHNNKTLTLGNTNIEDGVISGSASFVNFGNTEIIQNGTAKTFSIPVTFETLYLNDETATGTITFEESVSATTIENSGGSFNITFNAETTVTKPVTFETTGTLTLGNDTAGEFIFAGGMTHTQGNTILCGKIITNSAEVTLSDNTNIKMLTLTGDSAVQTTGADGTGSGAAITLGSVSGTEKALMLTGGTGSITVYGAVGAEDSIIGDITIESAEDVKFESTINCAQLTQTAGSGTSAFRDAVTASGAISLTGNIFTFDKDVTTQSSLSAEGTTITFSGAVRTEQDITVTGNSDTAKITFGSTATAANGKLSASANSISFAGTVNVADDITITSLGTNSNALFEEAVSTSAKLTASAETLTFTGTVSADGDISTTANNTTFGDTITTQSSLSAKGDTILFGGAISAVNDITITGNAVTLQKPAVTQGTFTVTNSGSFTIAEAADITADNGFTQGGTGTLTIGGTTAATKITTKNAPISFSGSGILTLNGDTSLISSSDTANGGDITIKTPIEAAGDLVQSLTLSAGKGKINFNSDTGTTNRIKDVSVQLASEVEFTKILKANKISVTAEKISLTQTAQLYTAETAVFSNSVILLLEPGCSINSAGTIEQNGSGENQIAGKITAQEITLKTNTYIYNETEIKAINAGTFTAGSSTTPADLYISALEGGIPAQVTFNAETHIFGNYALFNGNVIQNGNLSVEKDIILLNGNADAIYKDEIDGSSSSGVADLFKYTGRNSSVIAENSLSLFPDAMPDGTAINHSGEYSSTFSGFSGKTISAGQNFYDNGTALSPGGSWTLKLKANDKAMDAFAELYNAEIAYCTVTATTSGTAWLSAAENCTDGGNNTGVFFSRPEILVHNAANAKDTTGNANLSGTYTVYDNVIRVEFADSITKQPLKIENSCNEISAALSHIEFGGTAQKIFEGAYTTAECTQSTDGQGDLSVFFLKTADSDKWNTDATGISQGADESTDWNGTRRTAIPYLNIPKALDSVWQTLRDEHKNRIAHYYTQTPQLSSENGTSGATFTATADLCAPVLVAVHTGQELHAKNDGTAESQPFYDSHNFIELQYSEPVNIGNILLTSTEEETVQNTQATSDFGKIEGNSGNGITISGLIKTASGMLKTGSNGTEDNLVHSLYRKFSVTAGAEDSFNTHRLRISIAGYVDKTVSTARGSFKHWKGYIDSAETPSGTVTRLYSPLITDKYGNIIEATGTDAHDLPNLSVISEQAELYGKWDTLAPVFAAYKNITNDEDNGFEAIGTSNIDSTTLDRIEFHVFDNETNEPDWYIRTGWCNSSKSLFTPFSYAADIFGGARPFSTDEKVRTSGGLRYASLYDKSSSFSYKIDGGNPTSFSTDEITGGAKGLVFRTQSDITNTTGGEDGLYFAVYFSDSLIPLKTTFEVTYNENGFVTDLAGNRMKTETITTIDRTPPAFNMSIGAVPDDSGNSYEELYVIFNKKLNTNSVTVYNNDGTTETKQFSEALRKSLRFVDSGTKAPAQDIYVSTEREVTVLFQNEYFTGLKIPLNRSLTYGDIKNLWIQAFTEKTSVDPLSGVEDANVTYIQDTLGNYLPHKSAHAISDFAVNVVNPIYAYDARTTEDGAFFSQQMYQDGSWAVHDWNAEQKNYGTLSAGYDLFIEANLSDGSREAPEDTTVFAYFDTMPDTQALSVTYNENIAGTGLSSWRVWLPNYITDSSGTQERSPVFKALSPQNNAMSKQTVLSGIKGEAPADAKTTGEIQFSLNSTTMENAGWKSGDQISFLFALSDGSNNPVKICHTPEYDSLTDTYTTEESPLFALRLKNSGDLTSADLWSFKLQSITKQRGGVTILNNVINASKGEKTVVQVNMPSGGTLNVIVMTLDGNIVKYLQHGEASQGEHNYTWDGTTKSGKKVARGLYFIRVFGNGIDETRKVIVVK